MGELEVLWLIAKGIFLLIRWLVLLVYRVIRAIVRWLVNQGVDSAAPARMPIAKTATVAARPMAPPAQGALASVTYERALGALGDAAMAEAQRCAGEEQNERFADVLQGFVAQRALGLRQHVSAGNPNAIRYAERALADLSFVLETVREMAAQRRDPDKLLLLGDADALAEACYLPLLEFARGSGVRSSSSRAATLLGDKDLSIFLGFIPTGLAPIVLPSAWSTEIGWWPALAHEMGHDFYASVSGFDEDLRRRFRLPADPQLTRPPNRFGTADIQAAYSAWLSEIFADMFGTLMLGAAHVATMIWSFTDLKEPRNVILVEPVAARPRGPWVTYEEHPPAHLRVVLACRLLAQIGFPVEAAELEAEWRRAHGSPESLLVPTQAGTWYEIPEAPYVERGESMLQAMYQEGFGSLAGFSLRSMPGLDLGPREHQAALEARDAFIAGRSAPTRDPRCLIAGAVLAWKERPALAARVLRAARATIPSVGVSRRRLRLRAEDGMASELDPSAVDAALWREAFLLGEALAPPRASWIARRI